MADLLDFRVGDIVESLVDSPCNNRHIRAGDIGVVCGDPRTYGWYINGGVVHVDWGRNVYGHSCGGRCESGNGWDVSPCQIQLVDEMPPMLTAEELYALMDEEGVV